MKRIGLVTLAMVLALGSLGIAYAAWTDDITIEGTVNTGNLDLNVVDYSCSAIYKDLVTDELVPWHGWCGDDPYVNNPEYLPVASAGAAQTMTDDGATPVPVDDSVTIWFDKLFPCQWLYADILLEYDGTVPAKLWADAWPVDDPDFPDCALFAEYGVDVQYYAWCWDHDPRAEIGDGAHPGIDEFGEICDVGVQLHDGDFVLVKMAVHIPQVNELMNKACRFEGRIQAIQWNEYQGGGFYPEDYDD